jgi:hypothetical protein
VIPLTDAQIAEYFHRSYKTVDGLWFMKVEERLGFDPALDIDNEVWKVMPKVQARKLKSMSGLDKGLDALFECLTTKQTIDGFRFTAEKDADGNGFVMTISTCPWHELLVKSKRQHLSGKIGTLICDTEYGVWASEFGDDIAVEFGDRICKGCRECVLRFRRRPL